MEERVWKETPATEEMVVSRINTFPEGQIVAETNIRGGGGRIIGYNSAIYIKYNIKNPIPKTWKEFTDNGRCTESHKIQNPIGFGVNLTVDEGYHNQGVATRLIWRQLNIGIRFNKRGCILGAMCPGYHKYFDKMNVEDYVGTRREDGSRLDPELRLYEREGFRYLTIVPEYIPDEKSCNYGVLMYIKNPFYGYPKVMRSVIIQMIERWGFKMFGL